MRKRAVPVAIMVLGGVVGPWFAHAPHLEARPQIHAPETGMERTTDQIQVATDKLRTVPVVPGERPPLIPSGALAYSPAGVRVVSLAVDLSGHGGAVVGWLQ